MSTVALIVAGFAAPAAAATHLLEPSNDPFTVPAGASGDPLPFTIRASGFPAGTNVFVEQCDGTPPTATGWDPTLDCDLGSAPASAVADSGGVATFAATDDNHPFHPFVGPSPQQLFNCLSPTGASPGNGLPDSRTCQLRVSTNNTTATSDQVFVTLALPAGSGAAGAGGTGAVVEDGTTQAGQLPRTGSASAPLGGLGALMVVVGSLLVALGPRRRRSPRFERAYHLWMLERCGEPLRPR